MAGALRSRDLREMEERAATIPYEPPIEDPLRKGEMGPIRQLVHGENLHLKHVGEKIGGALGWAAAQVQRDSGTRGRALLNSAGEIGDQLAQRTREMQQAARLRLQHVRLRGGWLVRERPLHVLAAIGGAGFILGAALRIARSGHASRY